MEQERLNHLMMLYVHKEKIDKLDLTFVLNEFVGQSEHTLFNEEMAHYMK